MFISEANVHMKCTILSTELKKLRIVRKNYPIQICRKAEHPVDLNPNPGSSLTSSTNDHHTPLVIGLWIQTRFGFRTCMDFERNCWIEF